MGSKVKGRGRLPGRTVAYRPQHRAGVEPARIAWNRPVAGGRALHEHPVHRRVAVATAVVVAAAALAMASLVFLFVRGG